MGCEKGKERGWLFTIGRTFLFFSIEEFSTRMVSPIGKFSGCKSTIEGVVEENSSHCKSWTIGSFGGLLEEVTSCL